MCRAKTHIHRNVTVKHDTSRPFSELQPGKRRKSRIGENKMHDYSMYAAPWPSDIVSGFITPVLISVGVRDLFPDLRDCP